MAEPSWLTTAEGKVRLFIKKGFQFNVPLVIRAADTERIMPNERHFKPGEYLLDPADPKDAAVLEHPWIHRDFADGHVESPDQTRERLEAEEAKAAQVKAHQDALRAEADAAMARATVTAESGSATAEEITEELNTPLNQPRKPRPAK